MTNLIFKSKFTQLLLLLIGSVACLGMYFTMLSMLPVADMVKEFGVPVAVATTVANYGGGRLANYGSDDSCRNRNRRRFLACSCRQRIA